MRFVSNLSTRIDQQQKIWFECFRPYRVLDRQGIEVPVKTLEGNSFCDYTISYQSISVNTGALQSYHT